MYNKRGIFYLFIEILKEPVFYQKNLKEPIMINIKSIKLTPKTSTLNKTAAGGHFTEVSSVEDIPNVSEMIGKLCQLEKYESLISKLQNTNGIINFVTANEYSPLTHLLLKTAIPLSSNDVYNISNSGATLPDDYLIDASKYLGERGGGVAEAKEGMIKLDNALFGTPKVVTEKWLKAKGLDLNFIDKIVRNKTAAAAVKKSIVVYSERMEALKNENEDTEKIREINKRLIEDHECRVLLRNKKTLTEDQKSKLIPLTREEALRSLSNEELAMLKSGDFRQKAEVEASLVTKDKLLQELKYSRAAYAIEYNEIRYGASVKENDGAPTPRHPEGTPPECLPASDITVESLFAKAGLDLSLEDRRETGFLNWNPMTEILTAYEEILSEVEESYRASSDTSREKIISEITTKLTMFSTKLDEYRTTDPELINLKHQVNELLKVNTLDPEASTQVVPNFLKNQGKFKDAMRQLANRASNHGKTMIFDNVDNCILSAFHEVGEGKSKVSFSDGEKLKYFLSLYQNKEVRDINSKKVPPKKKIILISDNKLTNLPEGSVVVDMKTYPVNEEEANIIIQYCASPYLNSIAQARLTRGLMDIEAEYDQKERDEVYKKKVKAEKEKNDTLSKKGLISIISKPIHDMLRNTIVGLGQTRAIRLTQEVVSENVHGMGEREIENGQKLGDYFDTEAAMDKILKEDKDKLSATGVAMRKPKIKFSEYLMNKEEGAEWGTQVGNIAGNLKSIANDLLEMKNMKKTNDQLGLIISNINEKLQNPQLNAGEKQRLQESRQAYKEQQMAIQKDYNIRMGRRDATIKGMSHFTILYGAPGVGKCLGRGTSVLMFDGSLKNAEDIIAGDLLMGPDSKPRTVLSTTSGIGPLYKISQKLGEDYICNDAHILSLQNTHKPADQEPVFISAEDFCKNSRTFKGKYKGWKIGIEFPKQELPIDPYWMGLWLGDGTSRVPNITIGHKDPEIGIWLEKWAKDNNMFIRKEIYEDRACETWCFAGSQGRGSGQEREIRNLAITTLRNLNLLQNKHIPKIYWNNSSDNRLQLLAGLIDSDGYKTQSGSLQFTNVNKKLALEVLYLARSLGFRVTFAEGIKRITKINYEVMAYTVTIGGTLSRIPTKLPRKQGHDNPQKRSLRYEINVNPIGQGEYFGFAIDGDKQFLLGDFTVTHNSAWGDALADACQSISGQPYSLCEVNIQQTKNKWLGETERQTKELLNTIFSARNTVFMLDELDRMLPQDTVDSSGGGGGQSSTHETTKGQTALFLNEFETNIPKLVERGIFVIATTNHLNNLDKALVSRAKGQVYQVFPIKDPDEFVKFLNDNIESEKRDDPKSPWITSSKAGNTPEEKWNFTINYIRTKLDLKAIARKLAESQTNNAMGLRSIIALVQAACKEYDQYLLWQAELERGFVQDIRGMPLTTENLIGAIDLASYDPKDLRNCSIGVASMSARVRRAFEIESKEHPLEKYQIRDLTSLDPKATRTAYRVPKDLESILVGNMPIEEEESEQYDAVPIEFDDPNDPTKKIKDVAVVPKAKTMEELGKDGMQEDKTVTTPSVTTPQQKIPVPEKAKGKGKKEEKAIENENQDDKKATVSSSTTDYLYGFLKDKGIIKDDKIITIAKKEEKSVKIEDINKTKEGVKQEIQTQPQYQPNNLAQMIRSLDAEGDKKGNGPFDDLEKNGVGIFWGGQMFVAPANLMAMNPNKRK